MVYMYVGRCGCMWGGVGVCGEVHMYVERCGCICGGMGEHAGDFEVIISFPTLCGQGSGWHEGLLHPVGCPQIQGPYL